MSRTPRHVWTEMKSSYSHGGFAGFIIITVTYYSILNRHRHTLTNHRKKVRNITKPTAEITFNKGSVIEKAKFNNHEASLPASLTASNCYVV